MAYALELDNIHHDYSGTPSLSGVSLRLEPQHIGCLLGPSGSGKTTILRCIAGFECITSGTIKIKGEVVSAPGFTLPPEKRRLGIVFQEHALFPHLRVHENVAFGLSALPKEERRQTALGFLQKLDMASYAERFPHELSGGQQQRVALARALAPNPNLLLLDEPFSSLDPKLRGKMKRELRNLLKNFQVTTLLITHNQDEAFDIADELGVISNRKILQWGLPYDVYHQPQNQVVAEFLGKSSTLKATVRYDGKLETELGVLPGNAKEHGVRGKECLVLLRPDDIVHDDKAPAIAEVLYVAFRGMYQVYCLQLPSGTEVHCFTSSHHEQHAIGSKIGVRLDMNHVVVLPE